VNNRAKQELYIINQSPFVTVCRTLVLGGTLVVLQSQNTVTVLQCYCAILEQQHYTTVMISSSPQYIQVYKWLLQLLAHTTESIAMGLQAVEETVRSQLSKFIPSATTVIVPAVSQSTGMCLSSDTHFMLQTRKDVFV